jgi:nitroreductase
MQVKEAIYNRRAIKQFDADHRMKAAEEKELFEATIQAPTSFNIQHWRFMILRDPDLRAKIRKEFGNDQAQMTDASLTAMPRKSTGSPERLDPSPGCSTSLEVPKASRPTSERKVGMLSMPAISSFLPGILQCF